MKKLTIRASLLFVESEALRDFSMDVLALDAPNAYRELLLEHPPEQADLFNHNKHIGDEVLFCGIQVAKNNWKCPLTGGFITITPK